MTTEGMQGKVMRGMGKWAKAPEVWESARMCGRARESGPEALEAQESGRTCSRAWESRAEALEAQESSRNPETCRSVKCATKG